jgi:hypothetical protein
MRMSVILVQAAEPCESTPGSLKVLVLDGDAERAVVEELEQMRELP